MKKVTMVVELHLTVPDNIDHGELYLNNRPEDFNPVIDGKSVKNLVITGFGTAEVLHDNN